MKKSVLLQLILISVTACLFFGYEKNETIDPQLEINQYIYRLMVEDKWYLWADSVKPIPFDSCLESKNYLDELKYSKLDKWSYIDDRKTFTMYYNGKYIGHGFGRTMDTDSSFKISYVYNNSPMAKAGGKRGYEILEINDIKTQYIERNHLWDSIYGERKAGIVNHFKLKDHKDSIFEVDVLKDTIAQNTVIYKKIIELDDKNVGYLVFNSFLKNSYQELDSAFADFKRHRIRELILDLRYNSGGELYVANHLANLIAGSLFCGEVMGRIEFNHTKSFYNNTFHFEDLPFSIEPDRIVVITSKATASASEYLINVLRPYMEMVLIGEKTHGKPVGGRGYRFKDKVINLICFRITNSNGISDYFNGLNVDVRRVDDLCRDFGDPQESCLKEALFYLENYRFSDEISSEKPTDF